MTRSHSPAVPQATLSAEATRVALDGALAKAEALGVNMSFAVFDRGCNLAGFLRMPASFHISIEVAMAKGRQAAGLGIPMAAADEVLASEHDRVRRGLENRAGFMPIHGGIPIFHEDELIGGIGVSGGAEAEDVACAEAGVAAIQAHFPSG